MTKKNWNFWWYEIDGDGTPYDSPVKLSADDFEYIRNLYNEYIKKIINNQLIASILKIQNINTIFDTKNLSTVTGSREDYFLSLYLLYSL